MFSDAEVIHSYSRAQAFSDGVLVNLSANYPDLCKRHHRYPIACTAAVWHLIELAVDESNGSSHAGWIHDILWMSKFPTTKYSDGVGEVVEFVVGLPEGKYLQMKAHVGPGDQGEAVITVMLKGED
ncbi:DUF6573 family protein [Citrifermentans bremense]|uniref:DUF6573 family protein n=1 Tax=Citrifermentans bremense TaxID=60035 RepID=UPI000556CAAF|nr:DUF6573 family protein [Citrifermentans bremense]